MDVRSLKDARQQDECQLMNNRPDIDHPGRTP
jgi:hypothetical protein